MGNAAVVTIGKQHQPFTLEQLISSKDVSISERSGITERYLIGRREGVQLHGDVDKLHYAVGFLPKKVKTKTTVLPLVLPMRLINLIRVSFILVPLTKTPKRRMPLVWSWRGHWPASFSSRVL